MGEVGPEMRWTCLAHSRSIQRPAGIDRRMKGMMLSAALAFVALLGLASPAQAQWSDSFTAGEARTARDKGDVVPLFPKKINYILSFSCKSVALMCSNLASTVSLEFPAT